MQSNWSSNFVDNWHFMIVLFGETMHPRTDLRTDLRKDLKCTARRCFANNASMSSMA